MQVLNFRIRIILICSSLTSLRMQMEPPFLLPGIIATYSSNLEALGINVRVYYGLDYNYCLDSEIYYFENLTKIVRYPSKKR